LQVEVKIDSAYEEPKVIVLTSSMTEEVNRLVKKLSEDFPKMLAGIRNDRCELLEQTEIIRIYAASGKVYAVTAKGEYVLRRRLYELEEQLAGSSFVRISNSEMINLKKVEHFDLSFTGTIYVKLSNQTSAYVSRRYVSKIKTMLGI
jgi:DNA-binding LytR/AlgR family response regulator